VLRRRDVDNERSKSTSTTANHRSYIMKPKAFVSAIMAMSLALGGPVSVFAQADNQKNLDKNLARQGKLWVIFRECFDFWIATRIFRWVRYRARRGQGTCTQDKPVYSRYAVRDLPTAPRLGAFGLTRLRLPTAVEIEITPNSRIHCHHQPAGVRGLPLFARDVCSQESIELFAGRIK
jgi:hypothetical protein